MSIRNYSSSAAQTTLAAGCDASTTTLSVSATTGFPAVPFILAVDAGAAAQELVLVTNVAGTNLTVTRGYDSTVPVSHDAGAVVAHSHGAIDFREANAHVNATSGVHGATGALVGTTDAQALIAAALLAAHPVGDIKMSTVNVNPGTYLGGTWVAWGSGRVPVGVNAAETEFNTVEKTGGAKAVTLTAAQSGLRGHTHGVTDPGHTHRQTIDGSSTILNGGWAGHYGQNDTGASASFSGLNTGSSPTGVSVNAVAAQDATASHENLQPYITCFMFKRIS